MEIFDAFMRKTMDVLEFSREKISNFFINDQIATASMVVAAWISSIDGEIKDSEVAETEKFIKEFEFFEKFDKEKLTKEYRKWCKKFIDDPKDTALDALIEISSLKDKPEALPVLQLAARIAKSDVNACSLSEQKVITKLCSYLGVKIDSDCCKD